MVKRGKKDGDNSWEDDENVPLYTIGVASRLLDCDPSVLRRYEKAGLINPSRTSGNTRLYSRSELNALEEIHHLMSEEGLNSSGAQMVMELKKDIRRLESEVASLQAELDSLKRQLGQGKKAGTAAEGDKGEKRPS